MTSGFLGYHNITFIRSQNKDLFLKEISECNTESNLIDIPYLNKKYCTCKILVMLCGGKKVYKHLNEKLLSGQDTSTLTIQIFQWNV